MATDLFDEMFGQVWNTFFNNIVHCYCAIIIISYRCAIVKNTNIELSLNVDLSAARSKRTYLLIQ